MGQVNCLAPTRLDAMMGTADAKPITGCREAAPMSITLNLVENLLVMARKYQEMGQPQEAHRVLTHLCAFKELPADAAEETQVRLAEIALKRRKYAAARRRLLAALKHQPDQARY